MEGFGQIELVGLGFPGLRLSNTLVLNNRVQQSSQTALRLMGPQTERRLRTQGPN